MTFSYNPSLPNPPNDPADDVPGMQVNSASISGLIAVDHIGFNVSGGGQHKQITFNSNNVPGSFPVNPPVLFTNSIIGGNNGLFFYSGTAAQSSNQYSNSASNGSVLLMGGIIIKWGSQSFSGSQNPVVTFAQPFPNACFNVQLSLVNTMSATFTPQNVLTTTPTTTGFTARVGAAGASTWYWLAIGN